MGRERQEGKAGRKIRAYREREREIHSSSEKTSLVVVWLGPADTHSARINDLSCGVVCVAAAHPVTGGHRSAQSTSVVA